MNRLLRSEKILTTAVGDDLLMLNIKAGLYHNLNPMGARIWELLAVPTTLGEMVDQLVSEFAVSREDCAQQVGFFVEELRGKGLLDNSD
jgi:hypothetical protein